MTLRLRLLTAMVCAVTRRAPRDENAASMSARVPSDPYLEVARRLDWSPAHDTGALSVLEGDRKRGRIGAQQTIFHPPLLELTSATDAEAEPLELSSRIWVRVNPN